VLLKGSWWNPRRIRYGIETAGRRIIAIGAAVLVVRLPILEYAGKRHAPGGWEATEAAASGYYWRRWRWSVWR
jgi:hypothetical protein